MRRNTYRSDSVRYQAKTLKQPCVAFRGQGDGVVRQIASMDDSYGYTFVNCVWPHCSSISELAGIFCNKLTADSGNSQLTQADDVFVHTLDISRSMYYVRKSSRSQPAVLRCRAGSVYYRSNPGNMP